MTDLRLEPPPTTLPPGSTVWAYLRDSGGPTQDRSVEQQRLEVIEYCRMHGLTLIHPPFEDVHRSGGSVRKRDEFEYMMSLSSTHEKPQGLLIWNFARFSRGGAWDAQLYKAILRQRGIVIHSLTDKIPEGEFGPVIETIIDVSNKQKKDEAAMGAWRGLRHNVKQGAVSGTVPTGMQRTPIKVISAEGIERTAHRWDPDPAFKHRIHKAFQMRAEGKSLEQIHAEVQLFKTKNSFVTFFRNPIYIGTLRFGEMIVEDYCQPTIPRELWDKVQAIMDANAQRRHLKSDTAHPRRQAGTFLLSGLLKCARCGGAMVGHNSPQPYGEPYRSYKCANAKNKNGCTASKPIPAKIIEALVLENIHTFFDDPQNLINMLTAFQMQYGSLQTQVDEELASLSARLGPVRKKLTNTANAIASHGISSTLSKTLKDLEAQESDILQRMDQIKATATAPVLVPTLEQAAISSHNIQKDIRSKDPAFVRQTLLGIIHAIPIDRIEKQILAQIQLFHTPKKKADVTPVPTFHAPVGAPLYTHSIFTEGTVGDRGRKSKKTVM